jgi:hypothetical protein
VKAKFGVLQRHYPITENDLLLLRKTLDLVEPTRLKSGIEFVAMDTCGTSSATLRGIVTVARPGRATASELGPFDTYRERTI